jgi:hypothetical protein
MSRKVKGWNLPEDHEVDSTDPNFHTVAPPGFTGIWGYNYNEEGTLIEYRYFKNGQLHREDGPAVIYINIASAYFYLDGELYGYERWLRKLWETHKSDPVKGPKIASLMLGQRHDES